MRGGHARIALILSMALLAGCAVFHSRPRAPDVTLIRVTLVRAGLLEQDYRLRLRLHNPNAVSVKVKRIHYHVRLDGEPFASGSSDENVSLPPHGDGTVDLDARTDLLAFVGRLSRHARKSPAPPAIPYAISGSAILAMPGSPVVRFSRNGSVRVRL
ncbi:MAG TPA: LEA type 2 family protein [Gammaproteobacteria bacterium]|nr:LEA type 2 family protein [Gammaproteobacteria bacterium]